MSCPLAATKRTKVQDVHMSGHKRLVGEIALTIQVEQTSSRTGGALAPDQHSIVARKGSTESEQISLGVFVTTTDSRLSSV